jgi:two-component system, OmpR family, response regulator MtrA
VETSSKHVLIVDDNQAICNLLSSALRDYGIRYSALTDAIVARDLISRCRFDLYILDFQMPRLLGTELCKEIRAIDLDVPVIMYSAFFTQRLRFACWEAGATAVIDKIEVGELISLVKNHFGIAEPSQPRVRLSAVR